MEHVVGTLSLLAGLYCLLTVTNLISGGKQMREGGGTLARWFLVALALALIDLMPVSLGLLLRLVYEDSPSQDAVTTTGAVSSIVLTLANWSWIGRPVSFQASNESLSLCADDIVLDRVSALSLQMNLKPPVVRVLHSFSASGDVQAFAGGLAAPSLVVSDGVLHRLDADERDAILGHELAHIVNGSLWWFAIVAGLSATSSVLFSVAALAGPGDIGWRASLFGISAGYLLWVGLHMIVSRRLEIDCDLRAARAMGAERMGSALRKFHAASRLPDAGWLSLLIFSCATHPSLEERLHALKQLNDEARVPAELSERESARSRKPQTGAWIAFMLWLVILLGTSAWAMTRDLTYRPMILLWVAALVPSVLPWLAYWRMMRLQRSLLHHSYERRARSWRLSAGIVCVLFAAASHFCEPLIQFIDGLRIPILTMLYEFSFVWFLLGLLLIVNGFQAGSGGELLRKIRVKLHQGDFVGIRDLCRATPKSKRQHPHVRNNLALAQWATGRKDLACNTLRESMDDHPEYLLAKQNLIAMLLDEDQLEQAVEIIERWRANGLPNAAFELVAAKLDCLRGKFDEAEQSIKQSLRVIGIKNSPLRAEVAIGRGECEQAKQILDDCEELFPGDPYQLYTRALWAVRCQPDAADEAIAACEKMLKHVPLAMLKGQLDRLKGESPSDSETLNRT